MDMIMEKDSKESQRVINKVSNNSVQSSKKQVISSRRESQNIALRRESQNVALRRESQNISSGRKSEVTVPRRESTVARRESQTTASRRKSAVTTSYPESTVARRESQTTASRRKSAVTTSRLESAVARPESQTTATRRKSQITSSRQESAETTFIIDMEQFKNMQAFLDVINEKINLTNGARKLYTLSGELIQSMDEIDDDKEYVVASNIFTPLLYGQMKFITAEAEMLEKDSEPESTKLMSLRISRSVDSKEDRCMPKKKSKSNAPTESRLSIENVSSKDKKKKTKKVAKKSTVATAHTTSNLSQFKKAAAAAAAAATTTTAVSAKFASASSSTPSSSATRKRSKTPKLTVKMDSTTLPKYQLLSTGQRPSTASIKNRTPTPKPGAKIHQSNKNNMNNIR